MSHVRIGLAVVVAAVTCMSVLTIGQERDRAKVADKYKWNLADIYPDVAAWRAATMLFRPPARRRAWW